MKKTMLLVVVGLGVLLSGCASASEYEPNEDYDPAGYNDQNTDMEEPEPDIQEPNNQGGDVVQDGEIPALADRKIIYRANLSMATIDPNSTYNEVLTTMDSYTAYVEEADITTNRYELTIRVLSTEFDAFVDAIKSTGEVLAYSKTSEDITNTYSTFDARREALETRHTRLLELIEEAVDLDTILTLEEERFEVEAELNSIGNTLANFDSLVDFSTVTLLIQEAVQEIIVLPRTETPNLFVQEITKNSISIEAYNNTDDNVIIHIDVYQNGEFVEEYEEATFADSVIEATFDNLSSNKEYTIKVTAVADDHRLSLVDTRRVTTEATYGNRMTVVFGQSFSLLVTLFEVFGLVITGLLPFAITGSIIGVPAVILIKKRKQRTKGLHDKA